MVIAGHRGLFTKNKSTVRKGSLWKLILFNKLERYNSELYHSRFHVNFLRNVKGNRNDVYVVLYLNQISLMKKKGKNIL